MADTVVSFFVQTLGGLLTQELKLLSGVHDDLAWIKREHESMEACLINADRRRRRDKEVEAWVGQVRHLVFAAEDAIDSFMIEREMQRLLRDESVMHCVAFHTCFIKRLMVRRQFRAQIQRIRSDVKEVYERRGRYNLQDVKEPTSSSTPDGGHGDPGVAAPFIEEEDIVGTDDIVKKLLSVVEVNKEHRIVISIVGMGGLGKTTLAKKVYYKSKAKKFEEVIKSRAWVSVSQSFQIKDLLKQMLKELDKGREVVQMSESELQENIFNHLKGKGYLLVLDDIWEIDAWEGVKHALPREGRGIIIFTTRNEHVACPAEEAWCKLDLMPMGSELAWDLLCRKAFRNNHPPGSCPLHLVDVAKAMVERCKGLPLAIVAIGGLMSNKRSTLPSEWNDVLENLDWELNHNPDLARLNHALLTSYYYLPSHLKYCFLYCGLFPEDYSIKRKKLIRLWIAEGFIKECPGKTLEKVAGEYVVQLIKRSMLQPVIDPGTLQLKACKMHDLVRDMAIYLFKEEDFGAVLTNQNEIVTARRLAIQTNEMTTPNTGELNPRSLLMFIEQKFTSASFRPCLVNLRLLRVLDLESCKIESLPDELGGLIHLRYLNLKRSTVQILPPSLGRLCNLQTLDIRGTFVESLPDGAMLLRLRHLLLNTNPIDLGSIKMSNLAQLQTLYCVRPGEMLVEQLGYLTQMRKLCIIRVNGAYWTQLCASISKMQHLRSLSLGANSDDEQLQLETFSPPLYLEKLKLHGRIKNLPQWLRSLGCLCELILYGSRLEENPFGFLDELPNLAKLKLVNDAYLGKEMSLVPGGFPKLMHLGFVDMKELEKFDIYGPRWLQQVDIENCEKVYPQLHPPIGIGALNWGTLRTFGPHYIPDGRVELGRNRTGETYISYVPPAPPPILPESLRRAIDKFEHEELRP